MFSTSMLVYTRVSCKIFWILWDHPEKKMSASFQASAQRNDISMSISIIFANSKKGWCLVLILIPSRWRKFCDHLTCCVFFYVSCDDTCFSRTYLAHLQLYHIHITYSNPFVTLFGIFLGGYEIYDDKWSWLWVNNDKRTSEWTTITVVTVVSCARKMLTKIDHFGDPTGSSISKQPPWVHSSYPENLSLPNSDRPTPDPIITGGRFWSVIFDRNRPEIWDLETSRQLRKGTTTWCGKVYVILALLPFCWINHG